MDQLQLAEGTVLLLSDGAVLETFHDGYGHSFRTPVAWLGVKTEPRRHDRVRLTIGRVKRDTGQPLYGAELDLSWTDVIFEIEAAEEPGAREFFARVAQAAGR